MSTKRKIADSRPSKRRWVLELIGRWILGSTLFWLAAGPPEKPDASRVLKNDWGRDIPLVYNDEAHKLAQEFFETAYKQLSPAFPENSYMPPGLKSRLAWVFRHRDAGTLKLNVSADLAVMPGVSLAKVKTAICAYKNGEYYITFSGPIIYQFGVLQMREFGWLTTTNWHNFTGIVLAHEVIHFENLAYWLGHSNRVEQEEMRAHIVTAREVVAPLRAMGQPIGSPQFEKIDDLSKKCRYALPCEGLRRYLKQIRNSPKF